MSKGDWRRPRSSHVSEDDYGRNFEAIFGKKELKTWGSEGDEGTRVQWFDPHPRNVDLPRLIEDYVEKRFLEECGPVYIGGMEWFDAPRSDGRMEWTCAHGVGHGNHTHGCDGCCGRDDYPGRPVTGHWFVPHPHHPDQLLCTVCHAIIGGNPQRLMRGPHICEDPDNGTAT